ncbi:MAG: clostripain-related cysteine peptidase [Negativicutes bacterium]|jgi:hypothetical protein
MMKEDTKEWTVLIYANGNNDLEPETWQAMLAAEASCHTNINVIYEIGRVDTTLVKMFRPGLVLSRDCNEWTGVRRYLLTGGKSVLLNDFGSRNMANPHCLFEFIKAGIDGFPAEHYMVILGGHGYQFVGSMPDYSQELPYIMGFPEMADALDSASVQTGRKIDLLVADICYFNFIEVVYEFAKRAEHGVKNILTYICDGPICGMPYAQIIDHLQNKPSNSVSDLIKGLTEKLNLDLVAFALDYNKLEAIKQNFNELAAVYGNTKPQSRLSLNEILFTRDPNLPWYRLASQALQNLEEMVIAYKRISDNDYGLINIANTPTANAKLDSLYTRLSFTKNNAWTGLLIEQSSEHDASKNADIPAPIALTPEEVFAYISIMNPELGQDERICIIKNLIEYKNWMYPDTST